MKNLTLTLTVLLGIAQTTPAQDALITPGEITYQSNLEQRVLSEYFTEKKADPFYLLMASGSLLADSKVQQARSDFYSHLTTYQGDKIASKKNDKKARFIYENIHKAYLKKYQDQAAFEEIFYNGTFNQLSATSLYALALKELQIPYVVREEASGVYLIAYPTAERIRFESTTPTSVLTLTPAFQQQFVKSLRDRKVISAQEANSRSVEQLFEKYYFGDQQDLTLVQLAALQYMQDAVAKSEEKKFTEALHQMEKSYLLFPSPRTAYLVMLMTQSALEARKERDSVHASLLGRLAGFGDFGITHEMIQGEFARTLTYLLFEHGGKAEAERYYRVLSDKVGNIALANEIGYIYNYEAGRAALNQGRARESASLFGQAIERRPKSLEAANAMVAAMAKLFSSASTNLEHLKLLEDYGSKYPTLHEHNLFNEIRAAAYLIQSGIEFDMEKPQDGEKYRLEFEKILTGNPDLQVNGQLVGHAYSRSAIYYFRKGQTAKAKAIIESGLKISPNNYELVSRKQMIR